MKSRSLILAFFVLMSLVTLVVLVNFQNSTLSPNAEGARGAYFTQVEYPAIVYEGKNSIWNLTIFNNNLTTNGEGNASFFFKFYLDGDLWWSEYNSTDYETWQCGRGNFVTRIYQISTWDAAKPVNHELKIELYWYDGKVSQLQDVVSLPVPVAMHTELGNLMISSYIGVYLIAIFLLSFYMLIEGPIKISFTPQNNTVAFHQRSITTVASSIFKRVSNSLCFSIYSFLYHGK